MFGTLVTGVLLMSAGKGDRLLAMPGLFGNWGFTPAAPICCPPVWLKGCPKGVVLPVIPSWKRMNEWNDQNFRDSKGRFKKTPNICQISVFAFAETKFQYKILNIKFSVLNSQFHNFYQVKIYPKKMFYKYLLLCRSEVLQFNLQNQRKKQAHPSQSTWIEITFSNTTGTLEEQANFKSCDTLCILSTKHDFAHRQMGREGNI